MKSGLCHPNPIHDFLSPQKVLLHAQSEEDKKITNTKVFFQFNVITICAMQYEIFNPHLGTLWVLMVRRTHKVWTHKI